MNDSIAQTPKPPYYAVVFTSTMRDDAGPGYEETANRMLTLASQQPGFLGFETVRENLGITISYWQDLASIKAWKAQEEHLNAQSRGRTDWYAHYKVRIAKVERDYDYTA